MRAGTRLAIVAGLGIAVSGCGARTPAPRPQAARPTAPAPSAASYLTQAASLDRFAIESSRLALTRSRSPRTRAVASEMIHGHGGTSAQLSFAGRRLDLLPAATLLPAHQAMLDDLSAGDGFDATYTRQQLTVHQAAVTLHGDFAARGGSPTLRTVARNAVPIERRHLTILRRM